jgi:hypothetical protein
MKRLLFITITAGALLSCASITSRTSGLSELRDIYAQRASWVKSRNVTALFAQMTPDYSIRLTDGQTMSLADIRERWAFYYDKVLIQHIHFINDVQQIRSFGDSAVVTLEQKDRRTQNGPDGKPMEVEANVIHTESWIRTPDGWKLRFTQEGRQTRFLINGVPQPIK